MRGSLTIAWDGEMSVIVFHRQPAVLKETEIAIVTKKETYPVRRRWEGERTLWRGRQDYLYLGLCSQSVDGPVPR